jgi:4-amino-4-deoxy-L-arabinose transferase-like glycosyltransferase
VTALGNDEKTLWNSRLWAGLVIIIVAFVLSRFLYNMDYFLDDVFNIDIWAILGPQNFYLITEGIPFIVGTIGFIVLIWGFIKAAR